MKLQVTYQGNVYNVHKTLFRVGRSDTCDVVINDRYVSSTHFCLVKSGDSWIFCDGDTKEKASTNGSTVNGTWVGNGDCSYIMDDLDITIESHRIYIRVINDEQDPSKGTSTSQ